MTDPTQPIRTPVTFGNVPPPVQLRRAIIDKPHAWDNLGPRQIKGVVLHTTLGGELMTTDEYFRNPKSEGYHRALTDFGVAKQGYALQWNDLEGHRAPHASGPYLAGGYDGIELVEKYGINVVNRDIASIEFEGMTFDETTTAIQLDTAINLIAWVIDRYARIAWHDWPRRPDGCAAIYYHWEFCGKAYKLCPGYRVERVIDTIIARVQAILSQYQTGRMGSGLTTWFDPHPAAFAKRSLPPTIERRPTTINNHKWWDIADRLVRVTAELAPRLKYAAEKAPPVGMPLPIGKRFTATHVVEGDTIGDSPYWWVTKRGSRIPMAMTSPRLDREDLDS